MKVNLQVTNKKTWHAPGIVIKEVRKSLPFYRSNLGEYTHALRQMRNHWRNGKLTHTSIKFWCGNAGFLNKGQLFAELDSTHVFCATCKGRQIGSGLFGKPVINGQVVKYKPQI